MSSDESRTSASVFVPRKPVIGIDFGTNYSCVGVYRNGKVEIIPNDRGNRRTPSWVAFTDTTSLVGDEAKNRDRDSMNSAKTIFGFKQLVGHRKRDEDSSQPVQFDIVETGGKYSIPVECKGEVQHFLAEEITAMILAKLKETAEEYLQKRVNSAVITVPAYFNRTQRQALKDAASIAGLHVLRLVSGATAAALAFQIDQKLQPKEDLPRNVFSFCLGGGSCDVSVLTIEDGVLEVRSMAGDAHVGGDSIDSLMINHFVEEFEQQHKKNLRANKNALHHIGRTWEDAKKSLSSGTSSTPFQIMSLEDHLDLSTSITRDRFEEINNGLFRKIMGTVERALRDANMAEEDIHDIVVVGGSSRIPKIQHELQKFFNEKELNKNMHREEACAIGASVLAAILVGDTTEEIPQIMLLDVTPFSLGVEGSEGDMISVIKRNTNFPTKQSQNFSSEALKLPLRIFEGEGAMTKDNILIGTLDTMPTSIETSQITLTFDLDANLDIHAAIGTNYSFIGDKLGLTADEIEELISKSKEFRSEFPARNLRTDEIEELISNSNELPARNLRITCAYMISEAKIKYSKEEISEEKKNRVLNFCDEILQWIVANPRAKEEEFDAKRERVEIFCNSVMFQQ